MYYEKQVSFPFGCYYGGDYIPNDKTKMINCMSCYCRHSGLLRCCPASDAMDGEECRQKPVKMLHRIMYKELKNIHRYGGGYRAQKLNKKF
ncbi:Hypothetical predicted protein [Mytilus galloprovincialis]|nr:Hypothetical predicted protein [Mytilus galloprovincialis]